MTQTIWVRPKGPQAPRPGTRLRVQLEQYVDGLPLRKADGRPSNNVDARPVHTVGWAEVFEGGQVLLKITEATQAGRAAVALMREDMIDAVFWGSEPKVRLRP